MSDPREARPRLVAVGNPLRRDDGAGRAVARALEGRLPRAVEVVECGGEATEVLEAFSGAGRVVVIDALAGSPPGEPGRLHRFEADELPAAGFRASSHGFGVAEAVALGRALGRLPGHLVIYGLEGCDFNHGEGLTPAVEHAVDDVALGILSEFKDLTPSG